MKTLELTDEEFNILVIIMKHSVENLSPTEDGFVSVSTISFTKQALNPFKGLLLKVCEMNK